MTPVTKLFPIVFFLFSIPMWIAVTQGSKSALIPAIVWFVVSGVILWWSWPIKKVALSGDRFLISNYWREIEVPVECLAAVEEHQFNRNPNICLFFDPPTAFGRKVRIIVPWSVSGDEVSRIAAVLRPFVQKESNQSSEPKR